MPTNIVDRNDELAEIRHLISSLSNGGKIQFPIREFVGIGGVGKTVLLRQVAEESKVHNVLCIYVDVAERSINSNGGGEEVLNIIEKKWEETLANNQVETNSRFIQNYCGVLILDSLHLVDNETLIDIGEKVILPLSETGQVLILLGSRSRIDWGKPKYRLWRRTKSTILVSFPLSVTSEQLGPYSTLADEIQNITCGHPEANDVIVQI